MGTPDFSRVVLEGLLSSSDYEVSAVVTQPDRKIGRKQTLHQSPVKELAISQNLKLLQPEKLSSSIELDEIMTLGVDGIITAAYGQFLPGKLLESVKFAVNVHASLLPKYRGGAPIHYALMAGDSEIGVTIIEMVRKMDAGNIIAQRAIPVTDDDNVGTMFKKLAIIGRDLLLDSLPKYLVGEIKSTAQDESLVSFAPNISSAKERIDWTLSAREIFNQIRGMNPFPVAYTTWNDKRYKIYEAREIQAGGAVGEIIEKTKKRLVIACGEGALELLTVQAEGKPKMDIINFLNGFGREMEVGMKFGE